MSSLRRPLAIGGPTATGKTVLAVELASRLGAELVNADSRQVIRRLRVGTAAPTPVELGGVPCHLLDLCEPGARFTVADWLERARRTLDGLDARGVPAIFVGGTGQYLRALREGWDFGGTAPDAAVRAQLTDDASAPGGLERLAAELRGRDPDGAASVDLANPRRVIPALELLRGGATSLADARRRAGGVAVDTVILDAERDVHRDALQARMDGMFATGALVAEVHAELRRGTTPAALRRAGIGYAEALALAEGDIDVEQARAATLQRTRRYVKAQRTWFRHEPSVLRLERGAGVSTSTLADRVLTEVSSGRAGPRRESSR
ncbi:MAG TPA: tRNA (adenosine(37)-N6)-dimethylallyltransferase MiaA [Candidatus Dormibacteraeota bacterium]|nr:tRNA (adenosine(37)-N6)-dimethylallyltransferase MiaA [Candidatus Dormibacteraeota bacterium]